MNYPIIGKLHGIIIQSPTQSPWAVYATSIRTASSRYLSTNPDVKEAFAIQDCKDLGINYQELTEILDFVYAYKNLSA